MKSNGCCKLEEDNLPLTLCRLREESDENLSLPLPPINTPSNLVANYNIQPTNISYDRKELIWESTGAVIESLLNSG